MNLALFTYFIPAAFLAVPMYKTMGVYGLLNNQWSLILAMMTIASPYSIWVLKQASDKLPFELDEAAQHRRRVAAAALPARLPAADDAVAGRGRHLRAAARVERVPVRVPAAVATTRDITLGVALGNFLAGRRFAVGAADDDRPHLRAAAGGDLLHVQALHGRRAHRRRGEELMHEADRSRSAWQPSRSRTSRSPSAPPRCIHGISFDINDGEFVVLVGPSGCGKSTLLRMLAGLEEITGGTIAIDGKVVNDVESKDRDIAMVFQSYALYPHMTVARQHGVQPEAAQGRPEDDRASASRTRRRS